MIQTISQNTMFGSSKAAIGACEFKRLCTSNTEVPTSFLRKGIRLEAKPQANRAEALADLAAKFPGVAKALEKSPEVAVPTVGRVDASIRRLKEKTVR